MTSVEGSKCMGYPFKHKIGHSVDQVKVLVQEDRRIIVRNVANMWISFGSADQKRQSEHVVHHHICSYLTLCEFLAKWKTKKQQKKRIVISFPPYLTDLVPCEFSFPWTQDCINGEEISWYYRDLRKITGCICLVSNNALHKMLQVMAQLLGSMYKYPRRLF